MLTKDLVLARRRLGKIRPSYVTTTSAELLGVAARLSAAALDAVDQTLGSLEEVFDEEARAARNPKLVKGLAKIVLDRVQIEDAGPESEQLRRETFEKSAAVYRQLERHDSIESYRARLITVLGSLEPIEARLYSDLPEARRILGFDALSPEGILERYNLALVQALLIQARRVDLTVEAADVRKLRRVLSWLKLQRLVADVRTIEIEVQGKKGKKDTGERTKALLLGIEGPAAVLDMAKKYGLALANFAVAVPLLSKFKLDAVIQDGRGSTVLTVTHEDGLVSPLDGSPGHIPEEVATFADTLREAGFEVSLEPEPRHVGFTGMSVPDLAITRSGKSVAIELFHRWHASVLERRLNQLAERQDATLILGVDKALLKSNERLANRVADCAQAFTFNAFPTAKKLMGTLETLGLS